MSKRRIVDLSMVVLLPLLMSYALIGETFHEVAGTVMLVLMIIHLIFNRKWYQALFKGRYNARRIFQTVLDLVLLAMMIMQPISGIMMSQHLFTWLPSFPGIGMARRIHMLLAYWCYVLMCLHAGTHFLPMFKKLARNNKKVFNIVRVILIVVSVYGVYAFIKRRFPSYMSGRVAFAFFDFQEPRIFFFLDYIAIMILFMMLGVSIIYAFSHKRNKNKK